MRLNRTVRLIPLFLSVFAAASLAQSTTATLTLDGSGVNSQADNVNSVAAISGTATLGSYTGTFAGSVTGTYNADRTSTYNTGAFQITISPGNVVNGTLSFAATPLAITGQTLQESGIVATLTGGTGLFAGATGTFTLAGPATGRGLSTFVFTFTGSGTLTTVANVSSALRFVPVQPCRVVDTRNPAGPFGGPGITPGGTRSFAIPQSGCNIPATAQAYVLNVTVVPAGKLGYLTMWPTGRTQPYVSTINSPDGRTRANAAIVPAGTNGSISVYSTDNTQVVLDINGYFEAAGTSNLAYYPVSPCRVADTRRVSIDYGTNPIAGGDTRQFPVSGTCGIPASAKAYALNITVVPASPLGYITVWPAGQTKPLASTLNAPTGTIVANAAIIPAGDSGAISLFTTDPTHVVIDVNGYFAPAGSGGLSLYTVNPCRVVDTRNDVGPFGGPRIEGGMSTSYVLPNTTCVLPANAQAYSLNATVVPEGILNYLTLWPTGTVQPYVSTLNALDGIITANAALIPAGANGAVSAFATEATHLVLDVNGYFAP